MTSSVPDGMIWFAAEKVIKLARTLAARRLAPVTFAVNVVKLDNTDVMKLNYYIQKNYS